MPKQFKYYYGTAKGGKKAAATNKAKHGSEFYSRIGRIGGEASRNGGFASEKVGTDGLTGRQRAAKVGKKGGKISKRGPAKKKSEEKTKEEPRSFVEKKSFIGRLFNK